MYTISDSFLCNLIPNMFHFYTNFLRQTKELNSMSKKPARTAK